LLSDTQLSGNLSNVGTVGPKGTDL